MSSPSRNIAIYTEGCMYPFAKNPYAQPPQVTQPVATTIAQLQASGITTVILGLFHIGRNNNGIGPYQNPGDIYFNDTLVFSNGEFVGYRGYESDPSWPELMATVIGGSVTRLCASFGGGGVYDFTTLNQIYNDNGQSFSNTNLEKNLKAMKATLPGISIIDMDNEDDLYDQDSFVAFCQLLIGLGYGITFCPYCEPGFWNGALATINASNPGAVKWWNLQCYDGGSGNANINTFNSDWAMTTPGFILIGDWTNDSPAEMQSLMKVFDKEVCVGGGFIWLMDDIIKNGLSLDDYVNAIKNGLGGK